MSFTFWISRKLRLNGSKQGANATGVAIAVAGVSLALIIMEFTIAIVLGFKNQVTERILGFDGQIWVLPEYDPSTGSTDATMSYDLQLTDAIHEVLPEASTYMKFSQPGILKTDNDFAGIYFTGFDDTYVPVFEEGNIVDGEFPDFSDPANSQKIVLSRLTANALRLNTGDNITACFFINDAIKARKFEIAGIYESGFGDFDRTIVYAPISALQKVAAVDSTSGTQINIVVPKDIDIKQKAEDLQNIIIAHYQTDTMDKVYPVDNVQHTGAMYFNWLELLNTNVVVIFILMLCVSGFTLVSSMFIIILERIPTIGILRSLGTSKRQIRAIFVYMTLKIVGIGLIIGNIIGIGLLLVQKYYKVVTLDPEMYYLKYVPIEMDYLYFIYLNIGVVVVSWLILIMPSRMASRISPAVTMRFE